MLNSLLHLQNKLPSSLSFLQNKNAKKRQNLAQSLNKLCHAIDMKLSSKYDTASSYFPA